MSANFNLTWQRNRDTHCQKSQKHSVNQNVFGGNKLIWWKNIFFLSPSSTGSCIMPPGSFWWNLSKWRVLCFIWCVCVCVLISTNGCECVHLDSLDCSSQCTQCHAFCSCSCLCTALGGGVGWSLWQLSPEILPSWRHLNTTGRGMIESLSSCPISSRSHPQVTNHSARENNRLDLFFLQKLSNGILCVYFMKQLFVCVCWDIHWSYCNGQ